MTEITTILPDIGDVIVYGNAVKAHERLRELGVSPANAEKYFQNPDYWRFVVGEISEDEYTSALNSHMQSNLAKRQLRDVLDYSIGSPDKEIIGILERLSRDYRIYMATDTTPWQTQIIEGERGIDFGFASGFFRSYEMKLSKKKPDYFHRVFEVLGISPEEAVFIDDNPVNVGNAKDAGMRHTIVYKNKNQLLEELDGMGI